MLSGVPVGPPVVDGLEEMPCVFLVPVTKMTPEAPSALRGSRINGDGQSLSGNPDGQAPLQSQMTKA